MESEDQHREEPTDPNGSETSQDQHSMAFVVEELDHSYNILSSLHAKPLIIKTSNDHVEEPPPKRMKRLQKYRKEWESYKSFKTWLTCNPESPFKANCKVCDVSLNAELHVIRNHAKSKKHMERSRRYEKSVPSTMAVVMEPTLSNQVANAELQATKFFAKHNIPFNLVDHVFPVLRNMFPDSNIAQNLKLGVSKLTVIISNVTPPIQGNKMQEILKTSKFSFLVDVSADLTINVVVRFYNPESKRITSVLWNSIPTGMQDCTSATAEHFYKLIMEDFAKQGVQLKNIIGFASDNCSTTMDVNSSLTARLRDKYLGIVILRCICHSAHLCANEASKALPAECEQLARQIHNFLENNSRRQHGSKCFQTILELKPNEMLHPAQSHWLSLNPVVDQLLDHWEALKLFFANVTCTEEEAIEVSEISQSLCDPVMKAYYLFLQWVLPKVAIINTLFQSEKVLLPLLYRKVSQLLIDLLTSYMNRDYVVGRNLSQVDAEDQSHFLDYSNLYLGLTVEQYLQNAIISPAASIVFKENCRRFLVIVCQEFQRRFDFEDNSLMLLEYLIPQNALCNKYRQNHFSIAPLCEKFSRIASANIQHWQLIDNEWQKLPLMLDSLPSDITEEVEIDVFWGKLLDFTDVCTSEKEFSHLARFALDLLSLPHSDAKCERVFSKIWHAKENSEMK